MKKITEKDLVFLDALIGVIEQYMDSRECKEDFKVYGGATMKAPHKGVVYEHRNMSTGEAALDVLMEYGLADDDGYSIVPNERFYMIEYNENDKEGTAKILKALNS